MLTNNLLFVSDGVRKRFPQWIFRSLAKPLKNGWKSSLMRPVTEEEAENNVNSKYNKLIEDELFKVKKPRPTPSSGLSAPPTDRPLPVHLRT
jgi:hypothetical protein